MFGKFFMRCSLTVIGGFLLTGGMVVANAQMSAPLVGLIASHEGPGPAKVRPVLGVLGASSVRTAIPLPPDLTLVDLAPQGRWALVQRRWQGLGLVAFTGATPGDILAIDGALPNPDVLSFSPAGKSAGLLFKSRGVIQVLAGLDGATPRVAYQVDFFDPSGVSRIAVSDDGLLVMLLTNGGQVYMLSSSMTPLLAYAGSPMLGIAFVPNRSTAIIADGAAGTLNLARMVRGSPSVQTVTGNLDLTGGEVLVQASSDGASAFALATGGTLAYRVELATGSLQTLTLPATATRLDRLRDGDSFVFSAAPGRPVWFLTGNGSGLQAVFAANADDRPVIRAVR